MQNETKEKKETTILEIDPLDIVIPQCCREGWDSCIHTAKKEKPRKGNIAL